MCAIAPGAHAPMRIGPPGRREFQREFAAPLRPCVLKGVMDGWRARSWSFDWLRTQHGDARFLVGRNGSRIWAPREMTLGDYLAEILSRTGPQELYLASAQFLDRLPSLREDFSFPDYTWCRAASNTLMFIGGAGAQTPLHFDYSHTLLAQVVGRKRIRLYAPDQTPRLAPLPRELYQTFSGIQIDPPSAGEDGGERPASDFDFILEPGEVLFLPFGWWHAVDSLEPTVSITRSWWTFRLAVSEAPRILVDSLHTQLRSLMRGLPGRSLSTPDSQVSRPAMEPSRGR